MPPSPHRISFDESGPFTTGNVSQEWAVAAVVSTPGASATAPLEAWNRAWTETGRPAPELAAFHATRHRGRERLAAVARALAGQPSPGFSVVVVGGTPRAQTRGVAYIEAALAAVGEGARRWAEAPLVVDVWSARRSALNLPVVERLGRARLAPLWPGPGGTAPNIAVNWHVSTPYDDAALAWSDLLGWLALQELRAGATGPFPIVRLDPTLPNWRLRPEDIAATEAATTEAPRRPSVPAVPPPSLAQVHALLAEAEATLQRTRDITRAEQALQAARRLPSAGLPALDRDQLDLCTDSLELALDSHAGAPIPRHSERGPDPRSRRLLSAGRGLDAVLLYENRRIIARTHTWEFALALEEFRPVVAWMGDLAANPFGPPGAQPELGRMLGTLGQLIALHAHSQGDAAALDEADTCFEHAFSQFTSPEDRERHATYRLHLLAERLRVPTPGWTADRILAAATDLDNDGTRQAVERVLQGRSSAPVGAVFRAQAWAKLCHLLGEPSGLDDLLTGDTATLPTWHPWPALLGWLRAERLAAGARASDVPGATLYLGRRAQTPDLVGLQAFILLQEGAPTLAPAATVRGHVPAAARQGWERGGYDTRLGRLVAGTGRPTDLLPFNFC